MKPSGSCPGADPSSSKRNHPKLRALGRVKASGVYAVYDKAGRLLYVGESHSGRLYDTITRHFRAWEIARLDDGRRRGGAMYDRAKVSLFWWVLPAERAQAEQYRMIQALKPRDNAIECRGEGATCPI